MIAAMIALARVTEERLRSAPLVRRVVRDGAAFLARRSRIARALVRIRSRRII
jgi:hypothetical protein